MQHLTLQEVIDRINRTYGLDQKPLVFSDGGGDDRGQERPHRPEFYVPRITRRIASLMFSWYSS